MTTTVDTDNDLPLSANFDQVQADHYILNLKCNPYEKTFHGSVLLHLTYADPQATKIILDCADIRVHEVNAVVVGELKPHSNDGSQREGLDGDLSLDGRDLDADLHPDKGHAAPDEAQLGSALENRAMHSDSSRDISTRANNSDFISTSCNDTWKSDKASSKSHNGSEKDIMPSDNSDSKRNQYDIYASSSLTQNTLNSDNMLHNGPNKDNLTVNLSNKITENDVNITRKSSFDAMKHSRDDNTILNDLSPYNIPPRNAGISPSKAAWTARHVYADKGAPVVTCRRSLAFRTDANALYIELIHDSMKDSEIADQSSSLVSDRDAAEAQHPPSWIEVVYSTMPETRSLHWRRLGGEHQSDGGHLKQKSSSCLFNDSWMHDDSCTNNSCCLTDSWCVYTAASGINNRGFFPAQDLPQAMATWELYLRLMTPPKNPRTIVEKFAKLESEQLMQDGAELDHQLIGCHVVLTTGDIAPHDVTATLSLQQWKAVFKERPDESEEILYSATAMELPVSTFAIAIGPWKVHNVQEDLFNKAFEQHCLQSCQGTPRRNSEAFNFPAARLIGPPSLLSNIEPVLPAYLAAAVTAASWLLRPPSDNCQPGSNYLEASDAVTVSSKGQAQLTDMACQGAPSNLENDVATGQSSKVIMYPLPRLDVVVLPRSFSGLGLASPNLIFLSPSVLSGLSLHQIVPTISNQPTERIDGDLSFLVKLSHEIAHTWFGILIGNLDWTEAWLSEGFATFLEDFIHNKTLSLLPSLLDSSKMELLQLPSQKVNMELTQLRAQQKWNGLKLELENTVDDLQTLRPMKGDKLTDIDERPYVKNGLNPMAGQVQAHYLKGYFLLHYLMEQVGEKSFFYLLRVYFAKHQGQLVDSKSFLALVYEQHSKKIRLSLEEVVDVWLHAAGLPPHHKSCQSQSAAHNENTNDESLKQSSSKSTPEDVQDDQCPHLTHLTCLNTYLDLFKRVEATFQHILRVNSLWRQLKLKRKQDSNNWRQKQALQNFPPSVDSHSQVTLRWADQLSLLLDRLLQLEPRSLDSKIGSLIRTGYWSDWAGKLPISSNEASKKGQRGLDQQLSQSDQQLLVNSNQVTDGPPDRHQLQLLGQPDNYHKWCELVVANRWTNHYSDVSNFLTHHQGMGVYLYGEMAGPEGSPALKKLAIKTFQSIEMELDPATRKLIGQLCS